MSRAGGLRTVSAMDDHADGNVIPCAGADTGRVAAILARSFAEDPVISWMFADPDRQAARLWREPGAAAP